MADEHVYRPILDDRRKDDELAEARRILTHWRLKFTSANPEPMRSRHIAFVDIDVADTFAFFERWPVSALANDPTVMEYLEQDKRIAELEGALKSCWGQHGQELRFVVSVTGLGASPLSPQRIAEALCGRWSEDQRGITVKVDETSRQYLPEASS